MNGQASFVKLSGAGNDFILFDLKSKVNPPALWICKVCHRQEGVGADGILTCGPTPDPWRFWLRIFNKDGSAAEMCGNGLRCAALYLAESRNLKRNSDFCIDLISSQHLAHLSPSGLANVQIQIPQSSRQVRLAIDQRHFDGHLVDTGVPHFVVSLPGISGEALALKDIPLSTWGPKLRQHEFWRSCLAGGTNVTFVERLDAHHLAIRTFERGVEGETLACGTGAAAASWIHGNLRANGPFCIVDFPSGQQAQMALKSGTPPQLWQIGPAERVFWGEVAAPFSELCNSVK